MKTFERADLPAGEAREGGGLAERRRAGKLPEAARREAAEGLAEPAVDRAQRSIRAKTQLKSAPFLRGAVLRRRWSQGGQPGVSQLIWYHRPDESRPRPSDYLLVPVAEGEGLLEALSGALGASAEVVKERAIYLADGVRIHLDRVQGLGSFLEFEAIVGPDGDAGARERLDRLALAFGVTAERIVKVSYGDLLGG